jgi:hypothetical protein
MERPSLHFIELPPDAQEQITHPEPVFTTETIREAVLAEMASGKEMAARSQTERPVLANETLAVSAHERASWRARLWAHPIGKRIVQAAVFAGLIGAPAANALAPSPAYADESQTYSIQDGPWYVHADSPTIHSTTIGFANTGDTISITCHEAGDPVDGDAEWEVITDLTNGLHGIVADKGTTTPVHEGQEAGQLTALGIPECGETQAPPRQSPQPQSVFYSPLKSPTGLPGLDIADINLRVDGWSSGNCSPNQAADLPDGIHTLAGWSLGRLGPIYFLNSASFKQIADVHTIVLFDPGATSDMNSIDSCDPQYDSNGLLSAWLESNSSNRLLIMTGKDTEMKSDSNNPSSHSNYTALWKNYLAGIWNQPFADRALICDYNNMSHEDVLRRFPWIVNNTPANCPSTPIGNDYLTSWHP